MEIKVSEIFGEEIKEAGVHGEAAETTSMADD
jgi:hypothetical protein